MGSYSGPCEIFEVKEELDSRKRQGGFYRTRSTVVVDSADRSSRGSLDDDISKLFEAIKLKNSSRGLASPNQAGSSTGHLSKHQAMKRPIAASVPHSPRISCTESVSLKQALRDLCISKASEMAAMKRLSKPSGSPGVSEAGRIRSLYDSVVNETSRSGLPPYDSKGTMLEISVLPEKTLSNYLEKNMHQQLKVPRMKSFDLSADSSTRFQALKSPNQSTQSSPRFAVPSAKYEIGNTSRPSEIVSATNTVGTQVSKSPNQNTLLSPRFAIPKKQNIMETATPIDVSSMARKLVKQPPKLPTQSAHSSPIDTHSAMQTGTGTTKQNDDLPALRKVGAQAAKIETMPKGKQSPGSAQSCSDSVDDKLEPEKNVVTVKKAAGKTGASRSGRKGRLQIAPSFSVNGKGRLQTAPSFAVYGQRVTRLSRNTPRLSKSVLRNKSSSRKKTKQVPLSSASISNEGKGNFTPMTGQLVCQKCQCAIKAATEDSIQDSSASLPVNLGAEFSSPNTTKLGASKLQFSSSNYSGSRNVGKTKRNSKSSEKGEFSQSSKSIVGDLSTSTSNSYESTASRPSCGNKPHMSKDVRWEAIRYIKMRDGVLSLRHFNLLKKLGCGDIGTVYLAELIGSNCLFAIKVMDNDFLARRKKMPRAQTEREILRMLDHPFLPTLYAQFTSENLLCLVMEYCPGGDLHVLRQKQPGRSFPEPAARFYVAEVLLALEYLHMLGIIYRDLKPENILVREDGHIMLTDFDLSLRCDVSPTLLKSSSVDMDPVRISGPCTESKCIQPFCIEPSCKVSCFSPRFLPAAAKARKLKAENAALVRSLPQLVAEPTDARSNSFVGTHEYLAPEIIKGEGHGAAVDWWTFGIFLYELLYGTTPFKGSGNEETLANVVWQNLRFPDSPLVSFQARDLIRGLLMKEPENRLGSEKGAAEIKQHPFFDGLNWALIRCAIPPETLDAYDFGVPRIFPNGASSEFFECKATGEHLEFELF